MSEILVALGSGEHRLLQHRPLGCSRVQMLVRASFIRKKQIAHSQGHDRKLGLG
jgi:hypothetical protein